ncbi:YaiO family outer membrane beta-barrel protein [Lysobacter sp. HA18]
MAPSSRNARSTVALVACLWAGAASAQAVEATWHVVPRIEHSNVTINGNDGRWDVWSIAGGRSTQAGNWFDAAVARQDRNGLVDDEAQLSAGTRIGAWDTSATVQVAPDANFLAQWGYELRAERAAGANRRAGLGYRRLLFKDSSVNLASAHATFYRGDGEFGVDYRFGRNPQLDHDIRVLQLHGVTQSGRNQLGVYVAGGDYLFDALGIPGGSGSGWSANVAYARTITQSTRIRFELGEGRETDTFRQHLIAISLQYTR